MRAARIPHLLRFAAALVEAEEAGHLHLREVMAEEEAVHLNSCLVVVKAVQVVDHQR